MSEVYRDECGRRGVDPRAPSGVHSGSIADNLTGELDGYLAAVAPVFPATPTADQVRQLAAVLARWVRHLDEVADGPRVTNDPVGMWRWLGFPDRVPFPPVPPARAAGAVPRHRH
jgi:hypothetical protein